MQKLDRRSFLRRASLGAAALAPILTLRRKYAPELAIGFQTWVVREALAEDFAGTLGSLADQGYETLEMCSPAGYSRFGFGPIAELGTETIKSMITDAGLTCVSSHFTPMELRSSLEERIAFAHEFGLSQMVISSPGIRADASLDDWKRVSEDMNSWGEAITGSGLQFAYHNHNFEFEKVEGRLIYDILLDELDPEIVQMQFQVWVVSIGYHAADYFRAQPGRYISAHLADYSGKDEEQVPVGQGVVDWADFFEAASAGGLKNMYVEMGPETLAESAAYLHGLR